MNLISIFLTFIVLGLSIKPCCSSISINELKNATSSSVSCCEDKTCSDDSNNKNDKSENKSNGCDFCSPFFTCGSCCGFTFHDNIIKFNNLILKQKRTYSYYNVQFNSEYIGKMWQPPKLS
ncbi:MAG: hypothetical protein HQ463_02465 [Bacteroidetes bacterium]|nr:hypothetical protein [Bacteroidota bacterium]